MLTAEVTNRVIGFLENSGTGVAAALALATAVFCGWLFYKMYKAVTDSGHSD